MANKKFSELTEKLSTSNNDMFPIVDSLTSTNKKIKFSTIYSGILALIGLSNKEDVSNKSTNTSLGTSDTLYPSQNAVKTYIDTGLSAKQNFLGFTPENSANKSQANGYASLGSDGKIPSSQLPALAITDTFTAASQAAMLALTTAEKGDVCVRTDLNKSFILAVEPYSTLSNWQELLSPTDNVLSVNGQTGSVSLTTDNIPDFSEKRYVTEAEKTKLSNLSGTNTGDQDLSGYALKNNVLELNNTTPFTPDADYEPATKKYVDDNAGGSGGQTIYDATVGSSGADYTSVVTAYAAGKRRICLISNITETSKFTISHSDVLIESKAGKFFTITFDNAVTDNHIEIAASLSRVTLRNIKAVAGTGLAASKACIRFLGNSTDCTLDNVEADATASSNANAAFWIEVSSVQTNLLLNNIKGSAVTYGLYTSSVTAYRIIINNPDLTVSATNGHALRMAIAAGVDNQDYEINNPKLRTTSNNGSAVRYCLYLAGNPLTTATNVFKGIIRNLSLVMDTATSGGAGIYMFTPGVEIDRGFIDLNSDSVGDCIYVDAIGITYPKMARFTNLFLRGNKGVSGANGIYNISIENCNHRGNGGMCQLLENGTSGQVVQQKGNVSTSGYCGDTEVSWLRNTSGGTLTIGDVCIIDPNDSAGGGSSLTTTTVDGSPRRPVVCLEDLASNAYGWFITKGYTRKMNIFANASPNNIAVGDLIQTYTTVKKAYKSATPSKAFAISLSTATSDVTNFRAILLGYQV